MHLPACMYLECRLRGYKKMTNQLYTALNYNKSYSHTKSPTPPVKISRSAVFFFTKGGAHINSLRAKNGGINTVQ